MRGMIMLPRSLPVQTPSRVLYQLQQNQDQQGVIDLIHIDLIHNESKTKGCETRLRRGRGLRTTSSVASSMS